MTGTFTADPARLVAASVVGIIVLLLLIMKGKFHPVIAMMIAAVVIGIGSGMPLEMITSTVEKGVGQTLQHIALLIGLGSMFGGILEVSGGAQQVAQTLIQKFGQEKSGWALGITGLVIGTVVFLEAGVVILIPLAFSVSRKTGKSTLYYAIPLLAGLASGYAFIPPSAGTILVANVLNVDLGVMIIVGIVVGTIGMIVAGIVWGSVVGKKIHTELPASIKEMEAYDDTKMPPFRMVVFILMIPLSLILLSTISAYIPMIHPVREILEFLGTPFVALTIAILVEMYFLGVKQGYTTTELKRVLDRSLRPVGMILLVIASGGVIRWMLQDAGIGELIGPVLEKSGLPLVLAAFLIAALVRVSVGSAVVAMTMASGIIATMPAVEGLSQIYLAAICCAICGGSTAFSHVNDAGFWLVGSFLEIDEKTTLKSWSIMETIIGFTGLFCGLVISVFA